MIVYRIMYGGSIVIGVVVSKDGGTTSDQALAAWNEANPGYQGESAEVGRFLEQP